MGFVSLLEDAQDQRNENAHLEVGWFRYCSFVESRAAQQKSKLRKVELGRVLDQVGLLEEYLRHQADQSNVEEAMFVVGNPFLWPLRLIDAFNRQFAGGVRMQLTNPTRVSQIVSLMHALDQLLTGLPDHSDPDSKAQVMDKQARIKSLLDEYPDVARLSISSIATLFENSIALYREAKDLFSTLHAFQREASRLTAFETELAQIQQAIITLESLAAPLASAREESRRFGQIIERVRENWLKFLRLHVLVLRPARPSPQELNRLYLSRTQDDLVDLNHDAHFRVNGPSGSGKTLIVVHRAIRLSSESSEGVLIVTLNRALARKLSELIEAIGGVRAKCAIRVMSIDDLYVEVLGNYEDTSLLVPLDSVRTKVGEIHFALKWCEFFGGGGSSIRWNPHKLLTSPVRTSKKKKRSQSLLGRVMQAGRMDQHAACRYIKDEARYILSAYPATESREYLETVRTGRGLSLAFTRPYREVMLIVVELWLQWLAKNRFYDHESLASMAYSYGFGDRMRIESLPEAHFLIDEAQDLSTLDLRILKSLHPDPLGKNAIFVAGDFEQLVHGRALNTVAAGLGFQGRSRVLEQPFRSTCQIIDAAHRIVDSNPAVLAEQETSAPPTRRSPWNGSRPMVVRAKVEQQVQLAVEVVVSRKDRSVGIACNHDVLLADCLRALRASGIVCELLLENERMSSPDAGRPCGPERARCVLGSFRALKGFEFDSVLVLHMSSGVVPTAGIGEGEEWREAAASYSAMTRARDELIICYHGNPSPFLRCLGEAADWTEIPDEDELARGLDCALNSYLRASGWGTSE